MKYCTVRELKTNLRFIMTKVFNRIDLGYFREENPFSFFRQCFVFQPATLKVEMSCKCNVPPSQCANDRSGLSKLKLEPKFDYKIFDIGFDKGFKIISMRGRP